MSARSGVREKVPKLLGKRSQCSPGQNPKAPWVSLVGLPRRSPSSVLGGNDKRLKTEFRNSGILESVCAGKRIVYQWKASSRKPCHRVSPASPKDQFHTPTHRFQNSGIPEFHFPLLLKLFTLRGKKEFRKFIPDISLRTPTKDTAKRGAIKSGKWNSGIPDFWNLCAQENE